MVERPHSKTPSVASSHYLKGTETLRNHSAVPEGPSCDDSHCVAWKQILSHLDFEKTMVPGTCGWKPMRNAKLEDPVHSCLNF